MRWSVLVFFFSALILMSGFDLTKRERTGVGGVPGLTADGVCDDLCLDYLYALDGFENLPPWPSVFFSSETGTTDELAEGDDANPCTRSAPCQTAELIEDYLNRGSIIVYVDGDTFADVSVGEELENFDGMQVAPDCTGVPAGEPCAYLLPLDPKNPPTFDCEAATGVTGLAPNTFMDITSRIGVGRILAEKCPFAPDGGSSFHHTFHSTGSGAKTTFVATETANMAAEHIHGFRLSTGSMVAIGTRSQPRDLADFDEDCVSATCASVLCEDTDSPYGCCTADSASPGDAGDSQCVASVGTHPYEFASNVTILTNKDTELTNTQYGNASNGAWCFVSDCDASTCYMVVGGSRCVSPASEGDSTSLTGTHSTMVRNLNATAGFNHVDYMFRVTSTPWPAAFTRASGASGVVSTGSAANPGTVSVFLYQNTFTGGDYGFRTLIPFAGDTLNVTMRCNVFDQIQNTAGNAYIINQSGSALGGTTNYDIDESNAYDTDDGGADPDSFNFVNLEYDTASEVDFPNPGTGGTDTINNVGGVFFGAVEGGAEGENEIGDEGTDGNAFSDGTDDLTASSMVNNSDLIGDCPHTFVIPLATTAYIPRSVTKANIEIKTLHVGTHYKNIGAH